MGWFWIYIAILIVVSPVLAVLMVAYVIVGLIGMILDDIAAERQRRENG